MAEYKNGVNYRGNMSVEMGDVNPDIQTGRVVFVDKDKYENDPVYKAKIDACVSEGFMRSDEAGGGSADAIYDAIARVYHDNDSSSQYVATIVKGNYNDLMAKLNDNKVPVILVEFWDDLLNNHSMTDANAVYSFGTESVIFAVKIPTPHSGQSNSYNIINGGLLTWRANDTLSFSW